MVSSAILDLIYFKILYWRFNKSKSSVLSIVVLIGDAVNNCTNVTNKTSTIKNTNW